jgi:hypothetical protein
MKLTDAQKQFWLHTASTLAAALGPILVYTLQGTGNPLAMALAAALSTLLSSQLGAKMSIPAPAPVPVPAPCLPAAKAAAIVDVEKTPIAQKALDTAPAK